MTTTQKSYSNRTRARFLLIAGLLLGSFILWLSFIASIAWGAANIAYSDIYQAFTAFDCAGTYSQSSCFS